MAFEIVKNLIPGLPQEAYDGGVGKYVGVLAHSTANNGDSADGERSYESRTWNSAFVHFFVDDTKIEQCADTNYLAYGAGHTANHLGFVQVELCQTTDAAKFTAAYDRYVWLLAKLLFDRKLGVTDGVTLMSHAQSSAKWKETDHTDPIAYLASHNKTWANVVADVTAQYKEMEGNTMAAVPSTPAVHTKVIGSLVVTTKLGLNLRQEANTTATVLTVVPFNTECPVVAAVTGWYQIQYEGKTGWVSSQYVTYTAKPAEKPVEKPVQVASVITPAPKPVIAPVVTTPQKDSSIVPSVPPVTVPQHDPLDSAQKNGGQIKQQTSVDPISVPVVQTPPNAPTVDNSSSKPTVTPPNVPPVTPDINTVIEDVLKDPANILVLKQVYVFLNKLFGGK